MKVLALLLLACVSPSGDFDGDGWVGAADVVAFRHYLGTADPRADLDCSGRVNAGDYARLLTRWGDAPRYTGLKPYQLGIVINLDDPLSEAIATYYLERRGVPDANVVRVRLGNDAATNEAALATARANAASPPVRAWALAFTKPYRVGSYNSITFAWACGVYTRQSPGNYSDPGPSWPCPGGLPTMMLAGNTLDEVKALIERGISSDGTRPTGEAICLWTTDSARSHRCNSMSTPIVRNGVTLVRVQANTVSGRTLIIYHQGLASFPVTGNTLQPGALFDTLTSYGALPGTGQTTVWQILAAGATGSYGTVAEPSGSGWKFIKPVLFLGNYTGGKTLIESMAASVIKPYQGLMVGEPLANPWMRKVVE